METYSFFFKRNHATKSVRGCHINPGRLSVHVTVYPKVSTDCGDYSYWNVLFLKLVDTFIVINYV